MIIEELYAVLESSPKFNKNGYLSHIFATANSELELSGCWEFGFYNSKEDVVETYAVDIDKGVLERKEGKAFKRESDKVHELDLSKVKVDFMDALREASKFQKEKYIGQSPVRAIVVLQDLGKGPVWNVTFITAAFNVLNIKIDAGSSQIKFHELTNLMHWKK